MVISRAHGSPNFGADEIPVEFAVLHYTACSLEHTLEIFASRERGVAAHFVVAEDGVVYDLGTAGLVSVVAAKQGFLLGPIRRGAHAGISRVVVDGLEYTALNQCSIGIEMVQRNGNLFAYPEPQMAAVEELLRLLVARFPSLRSRGRVLGHEHIAGFRGKCDPGLMFDWRRLQTAVGLPPLPDAYHSVFWKEEDREFAETFLASRGEAPGVWGELSSALEARIGARGGVRASGG